MATSRVMKLRYAATCSVCTVPVGQGERAWWDAEAKQVRCLACHGGGDLRAAHAGSLEPERAPSPPTLDVGMAGGSAQATYDRLRRADDQRLEERWGRYVAPVARMLHQTPPSTRAWGKGAAGERRAATFLAETVVESGVGLVLHDRREPGTQRNIDHLVIVPSGVWVVDTKFLNGRVEQRDVGGLFRRDLRLYVDGRDRSKLAEDMAWQLVAVAQALPDGAAVPLRAALCFVGDAWGRFAKPFEQLGVLVAPRDAFAKALRAPGPLDPVTVERLAHHLALALPAKAG